MRNDLVFPVWKKKKEIEKKVCLNQLASVEMLLVLLENGLKIFFLQKDHIIIKKEELNIVRVPNMFSVFSFFRFSGCLPALMEFFSIHVITLKPESTSKHCFAENLFLEELCHRPFLMAFL